MENKLCTIYVCLTQSSLICEKQYTDWCQQMEQAGIGIALVQDKTQLLTLRTSDIERGLLLTDDVEAAKLTDMSFLILLNEYSKNQTLSEGAYCIETLNDMDATYFDRVYKRKHQLPWDILETERLKIREITLQDVEILEELYADPEVTRYMEPLFALEKEMEYTQNYIRYVYGFYGYGMWIVQEKEKGQLIGRVGLESKEGFDGLELGFMLGKKYWHQGYAREMCKAVLQYGREELLVYSYRALVHPENESSLRLCECLGFTKHDMQGQYIEMRIDFSKGTDEENKS